MRGHHTCLSTVSYIFFDLTLQVKKHNLTVNLTTFRVWCYACEREVFLEQRLTVHLSSSTAKLSEQVYSSGSGWLLATVSNWGSVN